VLPLTGKTATPIPPLELAFTNYGDQACVLGGHPRVTAFDAGGDLLGTAAPAGVARNRFLLPAGSIASATLRWTAAGCATSTARISVSEPGSTRATSAPLVVPGCGLAVTGFVNTY
jgi:hypothetical protein